MVFRIIPMLPLPPIMVPPGTAADEREHIEIWLRRTVLGEAGKARWQAAAETYTCSAGISQLGVN